MSFERPKRGCPTGHTLSGEGWERLDSLLQSQPLRRVWDALPDAERPATKRQVATEVERFCGQCEIGSPIGGLMPSGAPVSNCRLTERWAVTVVARLYAFRGTFDYAPPARAGPFIKKTAQWLVVAIRAADEWANMPRDEVAYRERAMHEWLRVMWPRATERTDAWNARGYLECQAAARQRARQAMQVQHEDATRDNAAEGPRRRPQPPANRDRGVRTPPDGIARVAADDTARTVVYDGHVHETSGGNVTADGDLLLFAMGGWYRCRRVGSPSGTPAPPQSGLLPPS